MRSGAKILKLKFAAPGLEELYEKEDINAIRDVFVNSVNSTHTYAPEIILDQRHEQWLSHGGSYSYESHFLHLAYGASAL